MYQHKNTMSSHSISISVQYLVVISLWCVSAVFASDSDNFPTFLKLRGKVAQCRASCAESFVVGHSIKFNYDGTTSTDMGCTTKANWKCNMCWDYCESLAVYERTRVQMCADDICLEGCQHACKFMQETSTSTSSTSEMVSPSSSAGLQLAEPKVAKTGVVISWTTAAGDKRLAYAVFGLTGAHGTWEEIQQTTAQRLLLPIDAKYDEITVAAFDSKGFVQQAGKKMVFQLRRSRRAVAQFEEKQENKFEFHTATYFTLFAFVSVVFLLVILIGIVVKRTKTVCSEAEDNSIVWV